MYEQAVIILSIVYGFFGFIVGLVTAACAKSKIKKLGGAFIGTVGSIISGLIFVIAVSDLKFKLSSMGFSLYNLLPSLIAATIGAVFLVYILGLVSGKK